MTVRALTSGVTALLNNQLALDVTANNLANVNTSGFKRSQVEFQDLLYLTLRKPGTDTAQGIPSPSGLQVGSTFISKPSFAIF